MEQEIHKAVINDDVEKLASILTTDLDYNVNQRDAGGYTAFAPACMRNRLTCVVLLLKDPRVDVDLPDNFGFHPLFHLACTDHIDITKWWIALRRDRWLGCDKSTLMDTSEYCTHKKKPIQLLRDYMNKPIQTRFEVQLELGLNYELATELFTLIVCVCDGLLEINKGNCPIETTRAVSFFKIAIQLPMELQMLICHRVFASTKQNITSKDIETSLQHLIGSGVVVY